MGFDKSKAIRAAEKSLAQGKIASAIQEYERIAEHDADDFTALNTLGDLYARVEKRAEAVACYRRVAEHYREQGFTLKAVAMYKKLTRFGPEDPKTALALASLYEHQGLSVEARQQYLIVAEAHTRAGETRQALDILRRIADLDPANTQVRLRLAESYACESLPDLAAEAYTQAGERLAARKEFEPALEAFVRALALSPASHAALQGLLAAHAALGTAYEAATILEHVVKERPGDNELRAMLTRAYIESEDSQDADRAARGLVSRDPASFPLLFEVVRLQLRSGATDDAARLLSWAADPALAGRHGAAFAELAQEVIARDPEQLEAHRLLVRAYKSLHDNAGMRAALESLAEAAAATGDVDEGRRALTRLLRLAPDDSERVRARLEELGGALLDPEEEAARKAAAEAPSFESFILEGNSTPPAAGAAQAPAPVFSWGDAGARTVTDPGSSFADLNDLTDGGAAAYDPSSFQVVPPVQNDGGQPPRAEFHEFDFGAHAAGARQDEAQAGEGVEHMLLQEVESVDFYIEQGYADIARDTLDMLERQYGPRPEIEERRARLSADAANADAANANTLTADAATTDALTAGASTANGFTSGVGGAAADATFAQTPTPAEANDHQPSNASQPANESQPANGSRPAASENSRPAAVGAPTPGIDPGLAAIFDEFREAVEDTEEEDSADFDTHYQMGLAYREMGLLDQAVEEFQTAAAMTAPGDGTPRYLQCCNLLGHCFLEKGLARPAAMWFKKGLDVPGHTEDEYQAMRFDLATAYEKMGDTDRAVEVLSEVYAINVSYRGVAERLRELQKVVR
jgi:tetratricopeptide (TPR) repeat protein